MRRAAAIALAAVFIVGIGLLDYLTPADVEFGLLYMLPVILVSWFVGLRTGLLFALVAMLAEAALDAALRPTVPAVAAWNGLSRLAVLAALATITDRMHQEREHWKAIDAERNTLLRLLEREFPRPLRALDWFSRTFVDTLGDSASEQVRRHFAALSPGFLAGRHGATVFRLQVLDNGTIARVTLAQGSGYRDIDARIEEAVNSVGRLPPLPQWLQGQSAGLILQVVYPDGL